MNLKYYIIGRTASFIPTIDVYEQEQVSVIGVQAVEKGVVHQYGVIDPASPVEVGKAIEVKGFVEKPKAE